MKKLAVFLVMGFLALGCSQVSPEPSGIAEWKDVLPVADAFVLKGDAKGMKAHCDFFGVPPEVQGRMDAVVASWRDAIPSWRHVSTQIMTPEEYEAAEKAEGGPRFSPARYNFQPEKLIVYTFLSKDRSLKGKRQFTMGVYRKEGKWYFAATY